MMETDEILNRIFDKLDKFDAKIDDLCDRSTKTETKLNDYLEVKQRNEEKKDRKYSYAFASFGIIFGFYAILKELL